MGHGRRTYESIGELSPAPWPSMRNLVMQTASAWVGPRALDDVRVTADAAKVYDQVPTYDLFDCHPTGGGSAAPESHLKGCQLGRSKVLNEKELGDLASERREPFLHLSDDDGNSTCNLLGPALHRVVTVSDG